MTVHNGFYLSGFTRYDRGEDGAIFVRFSDFGTIPKEEPKATIDKTRGYYYDADSDGYDSFTVKIPKKKTPKLVAGAIVMRTSKNSYSARCFDEARIAHFVEKTLDELRVKCAEFFEGA